MKNFLLLYLLIAFTSCQKKEKTNVIKHPNEGKKTFIKVGVFDGDGAGNISVIETIEALKIDKEIQASSISASEIIQGKLNNLNVIIFPGGSGSKQLNNLGIEGQKKVKDFIKNGNAAIGICAGAYMFCSTPTYPSLKIADVKHLDRKHYNRGRGLIEFELSEDAHQFFPELIGKPKFIQYFDGPIMQIIDQNPKVKKLAFYKSDIHINKGTPKGLTPGKLFSYIENYGKGQILAIGGHAESTPGMRWMIPRMVRIVTDKKIINYDKKWVHPELNNKEIFFDDKLSKIEKKNWWKLFSNNPQDKIQAMNKLYSLRSRPFVRWNIGLLRDENPEVRDLASKLLAATEYTYALPDLETAFKIENINSVKKSMKKALKKLSYTSPEK